MMTWNSLASKLSIPTCKDKYRNILEFRQWVNRLINISMIQYTWNNLPDTVDVRLMEWSLLMNGQFAFYQDDEITGGNIWSLPSAAGGTLNIYGYPTTAWIYGFNGFNKKCKPYVPGVTMTNESLQEFNAVICYDNALRIRYISYIHNACYRITDTLRSIDVLGKVMKSPYFIKCDSKQVESIKKILEQIDENRWSVYGAKSQFTDQLEILRTEVNPQVMSALWDTYNNHLDIYKDTFGINNNEQSDKNATLIVDEVNSNNNYIGLNCQVRLEARQQFCEIANKKFGLNISVEKNNNYREEELMDAMERLSRSSMAEAGGYRVESRD